MPNILNEAIATEYEALIGGSDDLLFVQPVGMSVGDADRFRRKLAERSLRMRVIKGSLARRALAGRGLTETGALFDGPSAVITAAPGERVDGVAITAAKLLAAWLKESGGELPAFKGGLLDGELLDGARAKSLQKMPGKPEVLATISGQILGPGRRLSGQLIAGGARIAGAVKTHIANLEKSAN